MWMHSEPIYDSPKKQFEIQILVSNWNDDHTRVLDKSEKRWLYGWKNAISFFPHLTPFNASSSRLALSNGPSSKSIKMS